MDHIYKDIYGWMTFPKFYKAMVKHFPNGSKFVEVGTYEGKSLSYLLVEAINQNKQFDVTAVDSFTFNSEDSGDNILDALIRNLSPIDYKLNIIKEQSWDAAEYFPNKSLNFCFLDADHVRASLEKDIKAWLPKMAQNSIIAGHDVCIEPYWPNEHPDVLAVINETFGEDGWDRSYVDEKVWVYHVK